MRISMLTFIAAAVLSVNASAFELKSNDIKPNAKISDEQVFDGFGCTGKNISPEVHWDGAPAETKSFALTMYDPDAPTGSGFWHWIVINIPASTHGFAKGIKLDNAHGKAIINDFGKAAYGGPCPPPGKPHRYILTIHALKTDKLDIPADATNAVVRFNIEGNTLKKASFKGLYGR